MVWWKSAKERNSLAVDVGIVQNGPKCRNQGLADTSRAQTAVVKRNDELSGQKLPRFESVETIGVAGQDDAQVGISLTFDQTLDRRGKAAQDGRNGTCRAHSREDKRLRALGEL